MYLLFVLVPVHLTKGVRTIQQKEQDKEFILHLHRI